jgi:hypothetical protein
MRNLLLVEQRRPSSDDNSDLREQAQPLHVMQ